MEKNVFLLVNTCPTFRNSKFFRFRLFWILFSFFNWKNCPKNGRNRVFFWVKHPFLWNESFLNYSILFWTLFPIFCRLMFLVHKKRNGAMANVWRANFPLPLLENHNFGNCSRCLELFWTLLQIFIFHSFSANEEIIEKNQFLLLLGPASCILCFIKTNKLWSVES